MSRLRCAVLARLGLVVTVGVVTSCAATGTAGGGPDDAPLVADPAAPAAAAPASSPPSAPVTIVVPKAPDVVTSTTTAPTKRAPSRTVTTPASPSPTTTTTATTTSPVKRADWAVFDYVLADRLIGGGDQAVSVAVAVDGEIVHRAAFGSRVPGDETIPDDRFRIASISKAMAAAATLRLVEAGKLKLNQPALPLVAEMFDIRLIDPRARAVTVRQLLGHRSGIGNFEFELLYGGAASCEQAAGIALSELLIGEPGKSYRYSNMNYCLIGLLLEAVTGRPYESVIRDQVLEPVGAGAMRVGGIGPPGRHDVLHATTPGRNYMDTLGASGSWVSSASDVVLFVDSLDPAKRGWHPVSDEMLALMKAPPRKRADGGRSGGTWYGLGLMVSVDGSYGHTGTLENTHAMTVVRSDGVTWAVLVSGENPWRTSDLRAIVDGALYVALAGR